MIERMDKLERTLGELLLGIIVYGILAEIVGILFVSERRFYTVGLLCGLLVAAGMAIHMAHNLDKALDWDAQFAQKSVRSAAMLRYCAVALVMILFSYFRVGNLFSCILGIMSLKVSAYLQPFTHKVINHILKIEEGGYENAIIDDDDEFDFGEWAEHGFHDPRSD